MPEGGIRLGNSGRNKGQAEEESRGTETKVRSSSEVPGRNSRMMMTVTN